MTAAALHASAPLGCGCADCAIDGEPCPECYRAWWAARHPNVIQIGSSATHPSVEPHPGSASSEAAGDARTEQDFLKWAHSTLVELNPSNYDHDDACACSSAAVEVMLAIEARLATPATQASNLSISGAAGPLGEPEILGAEPAGTLTVEQIIEVKQIVAGTAFICGFENTEQVVDATLEHLISIGALRAASKPGATK